MGSPAAVQAGFGDDEGFSESAAAPSGLSKEDENVTRIEGFSVEDVSGGKGLHTGGGNWIWNSDYERVR